LGELNKEFSQEINFNIPELGKYSTKEWGESALNEEQVKKTGTY